MGVQDRILRSKDSPFVVCRASEPLALPRVGASLGRAQPTRGAGSLVSRRSLVLVKREFLPSPPFGALTVPLVVGVTDHWCRRLNVPH